MGAAESSRRYWIFLLAAAVIVAADQASKAWVLGWLELHQSFEVIDGLFSITYVRNPGSAFGFLSGASPGFRSVFYTAITVVVALLILYYLKKEKADSLAMSLALAFVFAGALGNLIDRIRFGEVIDFLDFYLSSYHWPAFNVADSSISVGACLILLQLIRREKGSPDSQS
jgi:signal peptidase II